MFAYVRLFCWYAQEIIDASQIETECTEFSPGAVKVVVPESLPPVGQDFVNISLLLM